MSSKPQLPIQVIEHGNHMLVQFKEDLEVVRRFGQDLVEEDGRLMLHNVIDNCFKLLKQARQHHHQRNQSRQTKVVFRLLDAIDRRLRSLDYRGWYDPVYGWIETTFGEIVRSARSKLKRIRSNLQTAKLLGTVRRDEILQKAQRRRENWRSSQQELVHQIAAAEAEYALYVPLA